MLLTVKIAFMVLNSQKEGAMCAVELNWNGLELIRITLHTPKDIQEGSAEIIWNKKSFLSHPNTILWTSCIVWAALPTSVRLLLILPETLPDTFGSAHWQGFKPGTLESDRKRHSILPLSYWYWSKSSVQELNWYSALPSTESSNTSSKKFSLEIF